MTPNKRSEDQSLPLFLLVILIVLTVLVFSALSPMMDDDYSYCFSWADVSRITSLGQIPASMAMHRVLTNGRVFAHAIVQALLIRPKGAFVVLNAGNALLLCFLFGRFHPTLPARRRALLTAIGAMLLWNETPDFFRVFLWLDGAVNYSWGVSLMLLFLWPYAASYLGRPLQLRGLTMGLFWLLALAVGGWSENGSIATLFVALVLTGIVTVRERRLPLGLLVGILLAVLGYAFLMSAPATATRAGDFQFAALANRLKEMTAYCREHLLVLYLVCALSLTLALVCGADRRQVFLALLFALGGLGSLACFLFAAYFTDRHCCFTVIFTTLATVIALGSLPEKKYRVPTDLLAAGLAVVFAFNFVAGALDIVVGFGKTREREALIRAAHEAGQTELTLPCYSPSTKYAGTFYLFADPAEWPNDSVALYYGFDRVYGSEESAAPAAFSEEAIRP
ncbi:MAG: hypothetical protein J5927_02040 [Oscillospiraceae bacterium]|nr:hypothetical protein [Oscillospiraceae bacterium]